ncbi:hypothetical protein AB6A40_007810 [Gnathostoma spinigerum]|uniref:Rho-GAP domain-containing protein n=1 Tax=Gnathostoma spinigerum TaxID=75299 RepID=A0ABD6EUI1_9BILA
MPDERKKEKTRREDYCQLKENSKPKKPKKSLKFGKKSKKSKRGVDESASPPVTEETCAEESNIFGVSLAEATKRMKCHDGVPLPLIVRKCIDYVEENGLCMEGIYRVSAAKSRLDDLEEQINKSHVVELTNVHEATGLLKRYVRQLPENVLTQEMRGTFEEIAASHFFSMFAFLDILCLILI